MPHIKYLSFDTVLLINDQSYSSVVNRKLSCSSQATAPGLEEKLGKLAPAHAVAGFIAPYFVDRLVKNAHK